MNRLTHRLIAPKRKRYVGYPAAYFSVRQVFFDPTRGVDKIHRVVVMLFNSCPNGQNIGVKNDVLWRESNFVDENPIRPFANLNAALVIIGLPLFIKCHYDYCRAVAFYFLGRFNKFFFSFFQRNGVHNGFALQAFQTGFNHFPFRRIHHERDAGNIRLGHEQITKPIHGLYTVNHTLVKVDINDLSAIFDLFPRYGKRRIVVSFANQTGKFLRARDIAAFTNVDEIDVFGNVKRL